MPNLNVKYCIVCEDVRPEMQGKFAILGFFGLLPRVNIKLQEMGKALAKLVFLMHVEGDHGHYRFKFSLVGPDNKKVCPDVSLPSLEIMSDPTKNALAAVNLIGLVFKKEGAHKVRLSHKNDVFYESTFQVGQGTPDLYQPG